MKLDLHTFKGAIEQHKLFAPKARILLATSGGMDSMVLCDLMLKTGFQIELAHVNYGLRGKESDGDEAFVKKYATKHQLKIHATRIDTGKKAIELKKGIQETARILRYSWFNEIVTKSKLQVIVTAHHADDQAETIFFNFIRGSAVRGLSGMKRKDGKLVRPLLDFTRNEILDYALENKVKWREDSSNSETDYSRNKIRNIIFPALEEINPGFRNVLTNNAEVFRQFAGMAEDQAVSEIRKNVRTEDGQEIVSIEFIKSHPYPLIFLYEWLAPKGFTTEQIRAVQKLFSSQPGKLIRSGNHVLSLDRRRIILHEKEEESAGQGIIEVPGGSCDTPIRITTYKLKPSDVDLNYPANEAVLDLDKLSFPIVVRKWKPGDSFRPFGMKGRKKISDFLVQQKIPLHKKNRVFVAISAGQICWVVGYRISQDFCWTGTSNRSLRLVFQDK